MRDRGGRRPVLTMAMVTAGQRQFSAATVPNQWFAVASAAHHAGGRTHFSRLEGSKLRIVTSTTPYCCNFWQCVVILCQPTAFLGFDE